jgi:hypothetical protein
MALMNVQRYGQIFYVAKQVKSHRVRKYANTDGIEFFGSIIYCRTIKQGNLKQASHDKEAGALSR